MKKIVQNLIILRIIFCNKNGNHKQISNKNIKLYQINNKFQESL